MMSRGNTTPHAGNLSHSMRQNYTEHGVEEYYKQVARTYRNPHFQGVRSCLFSWYTRWWEKEQEYLASTPDDERVLVFDMACGSGEVTLAFAEWWLAGRKKFVEHTTASASTTPAPMTVPRRGSHLIPPPLGTEFPRPLVTAADPYTPEAYTERTSFSCSSHSFKDIAEGVLPQIITDLSSNPKLVVESTLPLEILEQNAAPHTSVTPSSTPQTEPAVQENRQLLAQENRQYAIEMVICSFALHLVERPSELFSLLWELSTKARWLVVLAPHKKPEVKEGWGWIKWNVDTWEQCPMSEPRGEILIDRVHCRVYRSTAMSGGYS